MPGTELQQDFNWHDFSGGGHYDWGTGGYLKLDGSSGRIQCRRRLKEPLTGPSNAIELSIHFTLGKSYRILLLDVSERPTVECFIDRDGRIAFHDGEGYVDSGVGIGAGQLWTAESELLRIRFGGFDFPGQSFRFELDDKTVLGMPLRAQSVAISGLELRTGVVEPGAVMWVQEYRQSRDDGVLEEERFQHRWERLPYIATGTPRRSGTRQPIGPSTTAGWKYARGTAAFSRGSPRSQGGVSSWT